VSISTIPVARSRALPVLLCLSHLRWDSVYQRPHHLISRAARSHSVIFFEEPLEVSAGPDLPRLVTRMTPEGVLVATPWIAPGQDEVAVEGQQARLLDELVAALATPVQVAWFYTPMALAFAASLHGVVDERMDLGLLAAIADRRPA